MPKFSPEALKNFTIKAKSAIKEYDNIPIEDLKISISKGNSKIGKVMNVSNMPVLSCGHCSHCAPYCYDMHSANFRKTVIMARAKNTSILRRDRKEYFRQIRLAISRTSYRYFRWHVGGEIVDFDYFAEMVKIAKENPHITFWTYTKMHHIVNLYVTLHGEIRSEAIPQNFHIMFSEWDGMPLDNPYNFPVFSCKLLAGNKNHDDSYFDSLYRCPGKCGACIASGRGCVAGETAYALEH